MADRVVYADRWQRMHRAFAPRPRSNKRGTPCPWEEWSGGRERFGAENNRQIERLINHVKNLGHVYCNLSRNNLCACYRQRCFRRVVRSKRNCIRRDFSYSLEKSPSSFRLSTYHRSLLDFLRELKKKRRSYFESPCFEATRFRFSVSSLFARGFNNIRQLSFIRVNIFIESDNCQSTHPCFALLAYPTVRRRLFNIGKSGRFCPMQKVASR